MLGLGFAFLTTPFIAQAQEMEGPNTGKVSLNAGVDYYSEYWFRGIAQENQGLIVQPYADVSLNLIENEDYTLDGYFGAWNSWHFQDPTEANGDDDFWYEADVFAGFSAGLPGGFGVDLSYINLYGPSGGDEFAEEIDLGVSYDDSGLWGDNGFALNPSATLAYEIDGGSDSGSNKGTYLGLGIEPNIPLGADAPFSLSVPVTLGLGLDDYYEDSLGNDDTYGFLDIGLVGSMPLAQDTAYGDWTVTGGVHYINLGDSAAQIGRDFNTIGGDDDDSIYFHVGLSMSY
jgi:hypothetical protein